MAPTLTNIPIELRRKIYEHLLLDDNFGTLGKRPSKLPPFQPSLLAASKQISEESREYFYGENSVLGEEIKFLCFSAHRDIFDSKIIVFHGCQSTEFMDVLKDSDESMDKATEHSFEDTKLAAMRGKEMARAGNLRVTVELYLVAETLTT
ncbi:hypothetical protein G7Y89_g7245 [Cudoniella acicularis]|uniref:Uncharacterized protein n=1 Tax=Cudoniella acicularis TaxID=354080 RepID=A0A8H4RIX3_9HELO|nr:hypothetical protein G7Y89_g7245 [Cudoniella acicularis]